RLAVPSSPTRRSSDLRSVPEPLTPLVGRADELAAIREGLTRARLLTIVGPGGAGKTRLAIEASRTEPAARLVELAPTGPEGVWRDRKSTRLNSSHVKI